MPTKPAMLDLFMRLVYRWRSVRRVTPCLYFNQVQSFKARRSGSINESAPIEASGVRTQPWAAMLPAGDPFTSATLQRSERIPMRLSEEPYRV